MLSVYEKLSEFQDKGFGLHYHSAKYTGAVFFIVACWLNPPTLLAACGRLPRLVLKPTPYLGQATYDATGNPIVVIDTNHYPTLPELVREFIFQHEAAHLLLGHVLPGGEAEGGFLDPQTSREHEALADRLASRAIFLKAGPDGMRQIAEWIKNNLVQDPFHPLPQWRADQIATLPDSLALIDGDDPQASASVVVKSQDVKWVTDCPPVVTYSLSFINHGNRPVTCVGKAVTYITHVHSGIVDTDSSHWRIFDAKEFSEPILLPHMELDEVNIGRPSTLFWYRAHESEIPGLAIPGDMPHLMACKFAD